MRPGKPKVEDIDGLATLLKDAGVDFGAEDVADALWLAGHMGDLSGVASQQQRDSGNKGNQLNIREEFIDDDSDDEVRRAQISLPTRQSQGRGSSQSKSGIAIKAPAAPALRIRLDLARALRPLRRQVPSPGQLEFDEAATLDQIADQQVWFPVLKPVPERWLEVALVVEATASLPLWHETIGEFQTLLERQGAFRRVTTWRLETEGKLHLFPHWQRLPQRQIPRRAKHLWDAAGRRLILLVSDCTSEAWYDGSMVRWLEKSGHQAPTAVVQLLPERLWSQSALAQGTSMRLSALEPGTVSAKLISRPRVPLLQQLLALTETQPTQGVTVPIVTLEAEPLKQWARVIAGAGDSQTLGVQFDPATFKSTQASPPPPAAPSAEDRVQRFRTTASLMAQRLAELMAAAPVSPPIVDLIRQTLLRGAEPVHVAEVYMGGLMEAYEMAVQDGKQPALEYDFAPGVRTILADALSRTKTESVLDAVSRYISERLGLNTRSFEALLRFDFQDDPSAQDLVLPFAEIAIPTLQRMGGEYAEIAEQFRTMPKVMPSPRRDPDDLATSLNNLASLYHHQGRYEEAEPLYQQALAMTKRLLGDEHPSVASSLNNLALLYDNLGRYEEAEPLYQQALAMRQRLLGDEHPDVATSLLNLGALRYHQGRYRDAQALLLQAQPIYLNTLGPDHPNTQALQSWIDATQAALNS